MRLPQQLFQTLGEAHWAFLEFLKSMIVWFNMIRIYIYIKDLKTYLSEKRMNVDLIFDHFTVP